MSRKIHVGDMLLIHISDEMAEREQDCSSTIMTVYDGNGKVRVLHGAPTSGHLWPIAKHIDSMVCTACSRDHLPAVYDLKL